MSRADLLLSIYEIDYSSLSEEMLKTQLRLLNVQLWNASGKDREITLKAIKQVRALLVQRRKERENKS
jgi:hypothetical protein